MKLIITVLFIMGALIFADQRIFAEGDSIDYVQRTLDNIIEKLSYTLNTNKQLTEENTQLKEKIEELSKSKQALEANIGAFKEEGLSLEKLQETLKDYQEKISQSETKIKELEQLKSSLGEKAGEYQERAIQGENKIVELTNARQALEERVKATNELQGKLNSYQVINSQLQETLKEYQAKVIQSDSRVKELEQSLKDKDKEKEKEKEELKGYKEKELSDLKNSLASQEKLLVNYKTDLGQADEKINVLIRQIEAQKKKMFEAFYGAGKAYTQFKRYKEAIESFQECLEINPDSAGVHYNLGILYQYEYGDRMGAISHLKRYLELNPKAKDRKEVEFLLDLLEK
jgi:chromosome segregation ATPase